MDYRREFFKQSNLIEDVDAEIAVDKNIEAYKYLRERGDVNLETVGIIFMFRFTAREISWPLIELWFRLECFKLYGSPSITR